MRTFLAVIFIAVAVVGLALITKNNRTPTVPTQSNITEVDGKQIIAITTKGGYTPQNTAAKANLPTTIVFKTNGTFDCSSAVRIPSIRFQAFLPPSGVKEVSIAPQKPGTTLSGTCSMGMYHFTISFN